MYNHKFFGKFFKKIDDFLGIFSHATKNMIQNLMLSSSRSYKTYSSRWDLSYNCSVNFQFDVIFLVTFENASMDTICPYTHSWEWKIHWIINTPLIPSSKETSSLNENLFHPFNVSRKTIIKIIKLWWLNKPTAKHANTYYESRQI